MPQLDSPRAAAGGFDIAGDVVIQKSTGASGPALAQLPPGPLGPICQASGSCSTTPGGFPATGQTTKCAAGDDGDLKKGAPLSYTNNGDGTITDNNTALVWEAKTNCGNAISATDLHDGDNYYPWAGSCSVGGALCGTDADCSSGTCNASDGQGTGRTIFKWVAALNAASFASHSDWRVPNKKELESIVDVGRYNPAVNPAFNSGSASCTVSSSYWSSTTFARSAAARDLVIG